MVCPCNLFFVVIYAVWPAKLLCVSVVLLHYAKGQYH